MGLPVILLQNNFVGVVQKFCLFCVLVFLCLCILFYVFVFGGIICLFHALMFVDSWIALGG